MSYSYIGTFVDVKNKKRIITADLSRLKAINLHSYRCDLRDVSPSGTAKDEDYLDITHDVIYDYAAYYRKEVVDNVEVNFVPYRKKDWNKDFNAFFITEEEYEANKDTLATYEIQLSVKEMAEFDESREDIIILYKKKVKKNDGVWYRLADFKKAEDKIKSEYLNKRDELHNLRKLRNTKEWFEMSEEARNNYLEEVGYMEESLEELECEYDAITYILNIFEFLQEDMGYPDKNEFDEVNYIWQDKDNREIEVYIEVC